MEGVSLHQTSLGIENQPISFNRSEPRVAGQEAFRDPSVAPACLTRIIDSTATGCASRPKANNPLRPYHFAPFPALTKTDPQALQTIDQRRATLDDPISPSSPASKIWCPDRIQNQRW